MSDIQSLVETFTNQLTSLLEGQALAQARAAVEAALGDHRAGRPSKVAPLAIGGKPRKKPPKQFCPVPGCKNAAAPIFGMVCADHKNVAKAKIKKYREARKAKKLGLKPTNAVKRRKTKTVGRPKKVAKVTKRRTKNTVRPTLVAAPPAAVAA